MSYDPRVPTAFGCQLYDWVPEQPIENNPERILRIRVDRPDGLSARELFERLVRKPGAETLSGIVVGSWWLTNDAPADSQKESLNAIAWAVPLLPKLTRLFIAHLTPLSVMASKRGPRIHLAALLSRCKSVQHFGYRGLEKLSINGLAPLQLQSLSIESSGGPMYDLWIQMRKWSLPDVESLLIGSFGYGWECNRQDDVRKMFLKSPLHALRRLSFRDCSKLAEVIPHLVRAPQFPQLEELDLSGGNLRDTEATALFTAVSSSRLKLLDLRENYLSSEMNRKFELLPLQILTSGQRQPGEE